MCRLLSVIAGVMSVTAPGMPAPLVVPLPPSALAAAQRLMRPSPAPAPAGELAEAMPLASEAASPGARCGAKLGAAEPGSLRLSRNRSGAVEPTSRGLCSAKSGATEPPSPCFSASSRSSMESRAGCQPHMNPVLWPRARRPLQTVTPTNEVPDPDQPAASAHAQPIRSGGAGLPSGGSVCNALLISDAERAGEAAGGQRLRNIRVCADSVCGLQVSWQSASPLPVACNFC